MSEDLWLDVATQILPPLSSGMDETVTLNLPAPDEQRLTILVNSNVKMSPHKLAAQAVHAALLHYGIDHGAVIVLGSTPTRIREQCDGLVRDAGRTEIAPGTLTAGVRRD